MKKWLRQLGVLGMGGAVALSAVFALPAAAAYVQPHIHHAPFGVVRVVVPMTSASPAVWGFKLHNLQNAMSGIKAWHGRLEARVVLYGPGVKLLMKPMKPNFKAEVDRLRAAGVKFEVCNNTLKAMNLDWHDLQGVKESDIVPAGFIEVGWLANHGWAVDAMN
ncbi:MAG: DsrE family protein [Betaproteobacteria bacterium]|nr:DsrE family protein [Betaproteobacteria bacterium]